MAEAQSPLAIGEKVDEGKENGLEEEMKTITNTKELPWYPLRAYSVKDVDEAAQIANGREAYLFEQVAGALYVYVKE